MNTGLPLTKLNYDKIMMSWGQQGVQTAAEPKWNSYDGDLQQAEVWSTFVCWRNLIMDFVHMRKSYIQKRSSDVYLGCGACVGRCHTNCGCHCSFFPGQDDWTHWCLNICSQAYPIHISKCMAVREVMIEVWGMMIEASESWDRRRLMVNYSALVKHVKFTLMVRFRL